ncbi:transposase [Agrobacterium tumefaciens]|nr:transposase [Agrobacterium tumefaciens]NSZ23004.1 transposase [Agrobacterium tumefaciens]NTB19089.1 transposase [Agrobacterium tumefaciens]
MPLRRPSARFDKAVSSIVAMRPSSTAGPASTLVIAAIVYWSSTCMADVLAHLRSTGKVVANAIMAHTLPVGWAHNAFSGYLQNH